MSSTSSSRKDRFASRSSSSFPSSDLQPRPVGRRCRDVPAPTVGPSHRVPLVVGARPGWASRRYRHLIEQWTEFWVAVAGAAAALTGLLFIAVSLRPRDIRGSTLMIGRARSAFYAFLTITIVSLLALMGSTTRWMAWPRRPLRS